MPRDIYRKYPPASSGPTTVRIYTSSEDGTITDTAGVKTVDTASSYVSVGTLSSGSYSQDKGFWFFDTSSIPDGATIVSATFNTYVNYSDNPPDMDYYFWSCNSACLGSTLDTSDFDIGGSNFRLINGTDVVLGWLSAPLVEVPEINKTGYTNVWCTAVGVDGGFVRFDSFENGSGRKAFLEVTYT